MRSPGQAGCHATVEPKSSHPAEDRMPRSRTRSIPLFMSSIIIAIRSYKSRVTGRLSCSCHPSSKGGGGGSLGSCGGGRERQKMGEGEDGNWRIPSLVSKRAGRGFGFKQRSQQAPPCPQPAPSFQAHPFPCLTAYLLLVHQLCVGSLVKLPQLGAVWCIEHRSPGVVHLRGGGRRHASGGVGGQGTGQGRQATQECAAAPPSGT